jgi:transcriptional regulator with XRE-family HTH domain
MAPTFDPIAFGERLRKEMDRTGKKTKPLHVELRDKLGKEAPGTSYGQVWTYVNGQAPIEPRREVLEALAEVFNVRVEFLAFGQGARTEAEEEVRRSQAPHTEQNFWSRVHDEIPDLAWLDLSVTGNLIGVTLRCHAFRTMVGRTVGGDGLLPLAEEWWRMVTNSAAAAEEILGVPIRQHHDAFSDYANGVLHALSGLIHSMELSEPRARRSPLELLAGPHEPRVEQEADDDEA